MRKTLTLAMIGSMTLIGAGQSFAGLIFSENFGTLADGTVLTDVNTAFTTVQQGESNSEKGTYSGALAINPSTIGDGASMQLAANAHGSPAQYQAFTRTYMAIPDLHTMSFSLKPNEMGNAPTSDGKWESALSISVNEFNTKNNATKGTLWQLKVAYDGALSYSDAGTDVTLDTNSPLQAGQAYHFVIQVNGTDSDYSDANGVAIAAGTMDLYLNDLLIGNDLPLSSITASQNGFRILADAQKVGGSQLDYEVDNINLWNEITATPIPEPASIGLALPGLLMLMRRRARTASHV